MGASGKRLFAKSDFHIPGPIWLFCIRAGALALLMGGSLGVALGQDLRASEQNLLQGRADLAIAELSSMLLRSPNSSDAHLLLCRAFLSEMRGEQAAEQCRLALRGSLAQDSTTQDWAGRAFGMEAEHAGPVAGLKLAVQVRTAFLTAYHLNPRNPAAANDLGEFYVNAPFIVGGGLARAASLADELQSSLPEVAHRIRALACEKRGDISGAEREFQGIAQHSQAPGAFVDLSCFYVRQKRPEKAAVAAQQAILLDRTLDSNVVDAASSLNDVQKTTEAVQTLHGYLDRGQKSDAAPVFRVHTLLGDIFASQGDKLNARKEYQSALSLASSYPPAQKGLASL